jgi:hypothetical protein
LAPGLAPAAVRLVTQFADFLFQRGDALGLQCLRVEQVLDLAVEFVDLLLGRVVLGARRGQGKT